MKSDKGRWNRNSSSQKWK